MTKLTIEEFSKIMYEEFNYDSWGWINPSSFAEPLSYTDTDKGDEEALGLKEVFERIVKRINGDK